MRWEDRRCGFAGDVEIDSAGQAGSFALSLATEFLDALVFCVVVDFGGSGADGDDVHGDGVVALETHFEEYVTELPLTAGGIGGFGLTDRPACDGISGFVSI